MRTYTRWMKAGKRGRLFHAIPDCRIGEVPDPSTPALCGARPQGWSPYWRASYHAGWDPAPDEDDCCCACYDKEAKRLEKKE